MTNIIASNVLANGLRTEMADTYNGLRARMADGRLGLVVEGLTATNRQHEFAYFEAAPHMDHWPRGNTVPADEMGSVTWKAYVYEWARRIKWSKFDRKDDQTQSLFDAARMVGQSAALLPERFMFDVINGTALTLPVIPKAPDGRDLYDTVGADGSTARFGVTSGNLLTGNGVATISAILKDYYAAVQQFLRFQDGKGQPLLIPEQVAAGTIIIHSAEDLQAFEQAFAMQRQGVGIKNDGTMGVVTTSNVVGAVQVSNVVQDASRNVQLWSSPRLATGDWYIFLRTPPKKPFFTLDREGLQEFQALEGDNNSDHTRNTGEEYVQWELRQGIGVALPYGTIKINN